MNRLFLLALFCLITKSLFTQNTNFSDSSGYELTSLPFPINTENDELAPYFFRNSRLFMFTSDRQYNGKNGGQNIFFSMLNDSIWKTPVLLSSFINSKYDDGSFAFSEKENKIYFARKVKRNTDIYECEAFVNDTNILVFSESVKNTVLNSEDWDAEPCISKDGQTIYFSSNRPGGIGGADIWASNWEGDKWGAPYNLGPKINSKNDEFTPFIREDQKEIFFSSNRKGGYGKCDIYSSILHDSGWTIPKNLGSLINSENDELFFFLKKDTAYFCSDRNKNFDIYTAAKKIKIVEKPVEKFVPCLYQVLNKNSNKPALNISFKSEDLVETKTLKIESDILNPGNFRFYAKPKNLHKIQLFSKEYLEYFEYIRPDSNIALLEKKIFLIPFENTFILNVSFQKNESVLNISSYPSLDSVVLMLKKYPDMNAEIAGHTDSLGNKSLNSWISQIRADVIKKYLVNKGIAAERLIAKGYGSTQPLKSNRTEEGRNTNRRVEFRTKRRNN